MSRRAGEEIKKLSVILLIGVLYLIFVRITGFGIPCPIRLLTHLQCPGCGMTRAGIALSKLHFSEAYHYNKFSITVVPVLLIYLSYHEYLYIKTGYRLTPSKQWQFAENTLLSIMFIFSVMYGIQRNIPALTALFKKVVNYCIFL